MRVVAIVAAATVIAGAVAGSGPGRDTLTAWEVYAAATDARVERELRDGRRFLALDFGPTGAADRRAVVAGDVVIRHLDSKEGTGRDIGVPPRWSIPGPGRFSFPGSTSTRSCRVSSATCPTWGSRMCSPRGC